MNKAIDDIEYTKGYKYQLKEDVLFDTNIKIKKTIETPFVTLYGHGTLLVKQGYAWDGPSGPTIDTDNFMRGSLAHDAIFQLARMGLLDKKWFDEANRMLLDICEQDGMSGVRRWYVKRGINTPFCKAAFSTKNKKKVYTAP